MYKIIRPDRDSTIFGYAKEKNAGIDEIIELNTVCGPDGFRPSRILMDFSALSQFLPEGIELDEDMLDGSEVNVFANFGFEQALIGSDENVFANFGISGDTTEQKTNVFANFGFAEGADSNPENLFVQFGFENLEPENVFSNFGFAQGAISSPENAFAEFGTGIAASTSSTNNVFCRAGLPRRPRREKTFEPGSGLDFLDDDGDGTGDGLFPAGAETSLVLRMWFANAQGLPKDYTLEARKVEAQWTEGSGRATNDPPTEEAVNWTQRTRNEDWSEPGGDFDQSFHVRERFKNADPDVNMDVEPLFAQGTEDGILIKREDESLNRLSELKFFSSNSSTIFKPHLLLGVEDFRFNPAEEAEQFEDTESISVFVQNLREVYKPRRARFNVKVREKFPQRDFLGIRPSEQLEQFEDPEAKPFLPERSLLYEVRDKATDHVVFPFSKTFTAVSFNEENGHFFDLDLNNVFPKRDYEIRFKFIDPNTGNTQIFENEQTFRVEE